jgi:molecular chaperone DnaK (HSP70)
MPAIEKAKIKLSSDGMSADVTQLNDLTGRFVSHTFTADELRHLLDRHEFMKLVSRTVDHALENTYAKFRRLGRDFQKRDIRRVFLVGGTSLLLGVPEFVSRLFPDTPVQCHEPFAAIAAGACRYAGQNFDPTLVHTYELKSWNPDRKEFDDVPIIEKGTQYPTVNPNDPASYAFKGKYISAASDQARELNLVFYERSEMIRPGTIFVMGPDGRMTEQSGEAQHVQRRRPLNPEAEDFIRPDPPCDRDEARRFVVGFGVDENKRLTVSVKDTRPGNRSKVKGADGRLIPLPIRDYPLVKL